MQEIRSLLKLAVPLIAGHVGGQLMSVVDTAMVGRLGSAALAGVGIGNGLFFTITLIGMGLVIGMDAPTSQAWGAGDAVRARRLLWSAIYLGTVVSIPISILLALSPLVLKACGYEPEIEEAARLFIWWRIPNVLPFMIFTALRGYLQAVGVTRPMIVATVLGNIVNFAGNGVLIFGDDALARVGLPRLGVPALGVVGSALSSSVSAILMAAVLAWAVARFESPVDPEGRAFSRELTFSIARLGFPFGLQLLAEVGVFSIVMMLTGHLGAVTAAAHQVAITLASFSFMFTIGIASATSVLVGHAIGRGDTPAARRAGFAGLICSACIMSTSAVAFYFRPELFARILTDKADVIAAALPLIQIAAFFQLSDGTQATGAGALRGAGDAHFPLWANFAGHYLVGLPIAIVLGFTFSLGAVGFWWGLSAGLTAVGIALLVRFVLLTRKTIERV